MANMQSVTLILATLLYVLSWLFIDSFFTLFFGWFAGMLKFFLIVQIQLACYHQYRLDVYTKYLLA